MMSTLSWLFNVRFFEEYPVRIDPTITVVMVNHSRLAKHYPRRGILDTWYEIKNNNNNKI